MNSYQIAYTVKQPSVRSAAHTTTSFFTPITIANIALVGVGALLLLVYVLQANAITANQYRIQHLDEEVSALSQLYMALDKERADLGETQLLTTFALEYGMVEAANVSYVFEGNAVAYRR